MEERNECEGGERGGGVPPRSPTTDMNPNARNNFVQSVIPNCSSSDHRGSSQLCASQSSSHPQWKHHAFDAVGRIALHAAEHALVTTALHTRLRVRK
eukprot:978271-Prorocentrum_minimum.AAC.2